MTARRAMIPRSPLSVSPSDNTHPPNQSSFGNPRRGMQNMSLRNQAVANAQAATATQPVVGTVTLNTAKGGELVLVPGTGEVTTPLVPATGEVTTPTDALGVANDADAEHIQSQSTDPRQTFSKFVESVLDDVDKYLSPTLLCEMLLQRASKSPDTTPAFRAASACWALDLLSQIHPVLAPIKEAVLPAMFLDYKAGKCVSGASAADRLRFTPGVLNGNPYLSHRFFFENHQSVQEQIVTLVRTHEKHRGMIMFRTDKTKMLLNQWRSDTKRLVFSAWHGFARSSATQRFTKHIFEKHGRREAKQVTLEACFYRWRHAVEQGRTAFLEERANTLVYQVDNAKNQFQLQCFRSDKYLRTVEELREEVSALRADRNKFREKVRELERGLQEFEKDSQAQLNSHVNEVLQTLTQWRGFCRTLVDERVGRVQRVRVDQSDQGSYSDSDSDNELVIEETTAVLEATPAPDFTPEGVLLRWCSNICTQSIVAKMSIVKNFTTDFQSGEVLVLVLHHVYPSKVPFSALQEQNLAKRYELIIELAGQVGISYLTKSNDIREGTGDIMLLTVAELFQRYIAKQRTEKCATGEADEGQRELPVVKYDAEMMPHLITEAKKEMVKLRAEESSMEAHETNLAAMEEAVTQHASYFARERLKGAPVEILDPKELGRYTRFNKDRYQDIAFKYAKAPADTSPEKWLSFDLQLGQLKKQLRKHFHEMRKVFRFYAGTAGTMTDMDFWRLCADIRVIDRQTSRHQIDKIFTIANCEDIPQKVEEDLESDPGSPMMGATTGGAADDEDEEENPSTELIATEFVECLIRMADLKYPGKMLQDRFVIFMSNHIAAYACKSESDKFKKEIFLPSTQLVLQRYHKDLAKIFQHYGVVPRGSKNSKKTMNGDAFNAFQGEANMRIDDATQNSLFVNMLGVGAEEMAQHDFMEILTCVAAIRTPTPFLGLDRKLDILASHVISTLRPKLKPHGVNLSDVKPVTTGSPLAASTRKDASIRRDKDASIRRDSPRSGPIE